jgi:hypothetical protein
MLMIQNFQITSKNQDQIYSITSTRTTQTPAPRHHRHLLRLSNLLPRWQDRLRNPSWPDTVGRRRRQPMSLKNTSSSLPKILTHATRFVGGLADELNSQISFGWPAIYYVFPVSIQSESCLFTAQQHLLMCSPGSAVAVERIFSGGRDTISLRRASLTPDTIRVLMLVKKRLHLTRAQADAALRC